MAYINGIGNRQPRITLYIANRPPLSEFEGDVYRPLQLSEASDIIKQTGNHWRKVLSILAKISFALFDTQCKTWQEYRDTKLLTDDGFEFIRFSPLAAQCDTNEISGVSIICGFNYAESNLNISALIPHHQFEKLKWSESHQCFVTPYFDWRQLNNEMLSVLIKMIQAKLTSN